MSTTYDVIQKAMQVIDWIGQGYTETQSCDSAKIGVATFRKTCASTPELTDMLIDARTRGHDALADALINIDNHKIHGQSDPKMAAVISKNIQWYLSKADPSRFAERIEVKQTLTMDRAIVDALTRARERTDVIDADYEVIPSVKQITQIVVDQTEEDILAELFR